jgi:REP element-mobilizing transposase RayT
MPRQRRVHVPGGLYHAVLRGNHRQAIFAGRRDYLCFEEIVALAVERYGASVFAYCWMTNHVHLAIQAGDAPLGAVMGVMASRYARAKQRALVTTGHLFERRYRARLVDAERYLLALVRYIHLNPVRAGIVARPADYPWSSHCAYIGAACPEWLCIDPVLGKLGSSVELARAVYVRFMNDAPACTDRAELSTAHRLGRPIRIDPKHAPGPVTQSSGHPRPARSLEEIAAEVVDERKLTIADLRSTRRRADLIEARREIARRALLEGAANLSQVARYLNRAPSTLSGQLYDRGSDTLQLTEQP